TPRNHLAAIDTNGNIQDWNPNADNDVYSLLVVNGKVYIGGLFTSVSGIPRGGFALIDTQGTLLNQ
ncbi:MAG: fibronectin type III domain-containing protein, partial [Gammaproteobacteria bacterium]|nr:fibronectin type III domain-containing protein [Gammaproteobacteria bacterium]